MGKLDRAKRFLAYLANVCPKDLNEAILLSNCIQAAQGRVKEIERKAKLDGKKDNVFQNMAGGFGEGEIGSFVALESSRLVNLFYQSEISGSFLVDQLKGESF